MGRKNTLVHDITTTELGVTLRYAPGETFVNTKQRRVPVSLDAPTFTLSHTAGMMLALTGVQALCLAGILYLLTGYLLRSLKDAPGRSRR